MRAYIRQTAKDDNSDGFDMPEETYRTFSVTNSDNHSTELQLWDWAPTSIDSLDTSEYSLREKLTAYWHNQFPDDRVHQANAPFDCNVHVGKRMFKEETVYSCSLFPSKAKKLDTLVRLLLPVSTLSSSASATFFGELVFFFAHKFGSR